MQLALYKGPPTKPLFWLGEGFIRLCTLSKYSHCELVINGVCYSSSYRDGGVRAKFIDLNSGKWDLLPVDGDEKLAIARFAADKGKRYDWLGMLRVCPLLRWLPRNDSKRFCSEMVAWMLGTEDPERFSPEHLARNAR